MQAGSVYRIRTVAANQFIAGIAQNAADVATLDLFANPLLIAGDSMGIGAGKTVRARLRELRIVSVQNLAWEVWLFGLTPFGGATIGAERYLGRVVFAVADGVQATGDSFFYYYAGNLDLTYQDLANVGKIYMRLINRSVAAKLAVGPGAIEIEMALEILQGR